MDISKLSVEDISALSGRMVCGNIPPKSREEAQEHLKEIERLLEHERSLMEREATANRELRAAKENAVAQWRDVILPNFDVSRFDPATISVWQSRGIPEEFRGVVWEQVIGNPRGITEKMQQMCRHKAKERNAKTEVQTSMERDFGTDFVNTSSGAANGRDVSHQISVDLPRTIIVRPGPSPRSGSPRSGSPLPDSPVGVVDTHPVFTLDASGTTLVSALSRSKEEIECLSDLLCAFVEFRPDIGYVQGMSYLAAMLLMNMGTKKAFVALATLMTMGHFPHFYTVSHVGMSAHFAVFEDALERASPKLYRLFCVIGVRPQMYVIDWWMSLFSRALSYDLAARCWDLFLLDNAYLYRISVCLLLYFESRWDEDAELSEVMSVVSRIQHAGIAEERFFQLVADSKSRGPDLEQIHEIMKIHLSGLQDPSDEL